MRGQTSIEFLILLGFMLFIFASFFVVATNIVSQNNNRATREAIVTVASVIEDELLIANQVNDGYRRSFLLPDTIVDKEYTATFNGTEFFVKTVEDQEIYEVEYLVFLPFADIDSPGAPSGLVLTGGDALVVTKNETGVHVYEGT